MPRDLKNETHRHPGPDTRSTCIWGVLMQTRSNRILWTKCLRAESLNRGLERIIQQSFSPKKFRTGPPRQPHSTNPSTASPGKPLQKRTPGATWNSNKKKNFSLGKNTDVSQGGVIQPWADLSQDQMQPHQIGCHF